MTSGLQTMASPGHRRLPPLPGVDGSITPVWYLLTNSGSSGDHKVGPIQMTCGLPATGSLGLKLRHPLLGVYDLRIPV